MYQNLVRGLAPALGLIEARISCTLQPLDNGPDRLTEKIRKGRGGDLKGDESPQLESRRRVGR